MLTYMNLNSKSSLLKNKVKKYRVKSESHYYNNELILAEKFASKAYKISKKIKDLEAKEIANVVHNKAIFFLRRKRFDLSEKYFRKSLQLKSSASVIEKKDIAATLNATAQLYKAIGDYEKTNNYFKEAVKIADEINDIYLAPYLFDIARLNKIVGKTKFALSFYVKSISVALEYTVNKDRIPGFYEQILYNCYNDLTEIHLLKGDIYKARNYHTLALNILNNQTNFFEAYKRFEIPAKIFIKEGEHLLAITQLNNAEQAIIEEYQGFEVGKDLANIIHQIGDCYCHLKQYENALRTYQNALKAVCNQFCCDKIESLPTIEEIYNKRSAIASLSYKASTWFILYQIEQKQKYLLHALETYQLIATLLPLTRKDYVEENSKFQLAEETKGIFQKAIDTCFSLYKLIKDQKYQQFAFEFTESAKAIVLQENIQANHAIKGVDEPIQQKDLDFRSKIAFYQNSINTNERTNGDAEQLAKWQTELFKCKQEYEQFHQEIESLYPEYYAVKYANTLTTVKSLQKSLPVDTALIEYFLGEENLQVFIITSNNFEVYQIELDYKELQNEITAFKKLIEHLNIAGCSKEYEQFKNLAHHLYKKLLEQGLQNLDVSIKRLVIIPDRLLFNFPFEALVTTEEEHFPSANYHLKNLDYLLKNYSVSYNYSASLFYETSDFSSSSYSKNFIGFAPKFEDLLNNISETKAIQKEVSGAIFLDEEAHFNNFKQNAKTSKILHLSTHAKQNHDNHKLSEIHFSDSVITNYHIENMQINAGLTVLSACETASGFIQSGEGAMSLARSFFLAGCPSLVSSLWRADDESTADIMLYFYQHLKNGVTKDVALQQAKLQYCNEAGIRQSHPFYWAGFVQSGSRKALF